MKNILFIATMGIITCISAKATSVDLPVVTSKCCTAESTGGSCERYYCTYKGVQTEYTDCATCKTADTVLEKNGSYEPCGDGIVFNVNVGKCVYSAVVGPILTVCDAGTYSENGECIPCPEPGTSNPGTKMITGCYIPEGTITTDNTGTLTYTGDCHYDDSVISIDPGLPVEPVTPVIP